MNIEIKHENNKYLMLCDGILKIESRFPIIQIAPEVEIFKIGTNENEFYLYHAIKQTYILSKRVFHAISNYSAQYKTFSAHYHTDGGIDRCNFIFEDGTHLDQSALSISKVEYGHRIFQLTENTWDYFDEEKKKFLCPKNTSYKQELGNRFLYYGSFLLQSGKRYLWYYDKEERKNQFITKKTYLYKFKNTLSIEFIEIPNTHFFFGINFTRRAEITNTHIRIFYRIDMHHIDASEEEYEEAQYLASINSFLVKNQLGWTIIKYNSKEKYFYRQRYNYYKDRPTIKVYDDFVFLQKANGECEFYQEDRECSSRIWQTVQLVENKDQPYVTATDFFNQTTNIYISDLEKEFLNLKEKMKITEATSFKLYVPMKYKENYPTTQTIYNIDYYVFGSAQEGENNYLGSEKSIINTSIVTGSKIAWIQLNKKIIYLVKYEVKNTYTILEKILLDEEDYKLFKKNCIKKFCKFQNSCPSNIILPKLREIFKKNQDYSDVDESQEPKQTNTSTTETLSQTSEAAPILEQTDIKNEVSDNKTIDLITRVRDTYNFLIQHANSNKVLEAILILYKEKIPELYGVNQELDALMGQLFPLTTPEDIVDQSFIADFKTLIDKEDKQNFNICFDFYIKIEKRTLYDSLLLTLKKCNLEDSYLSIFNKKLDDFRKSAMLASAEQNAYLALFSHLIKIGQDLPEISPKEKPSVRKINVQDIDPAHRSQLLTIGKHTCDFNIDEKKISLGLEENIDIESLKMGYREFASKGTCMLILLPFEQKQKLDQSQGLYTIIGEGKSLNENQILGKNANSDIVSGNKRILLFIRNADNKTCMFYDETKYNNHKEVKDPNPKANRNIILFELKSILRYKER